MIVSFIWVSSNKFIQISTELYTTCDVRRTMLYILRVPLMCGREYVRELDSREKNNCKLLLSSSLNLFLSLSLPMQWIDVWRFDSVNRIFSELLNVSLCVCGYQHREMGVCMCDFFFYFCERKKITRWIYIIIENHSFRTGTPNSSDKTASSRRNV